jgi:2-dehydro-3-deoxygalactonokinase
MRILGDWGTTRLRLFRTDGERREGPGIGKLDGMSPEDALLTALGPWNADARRHGMCLSGMAGGRGGLAELPYLQSPIDADQWRKATAQINVDGIDIRIARGLRSRNFAGKPDLMRGEETQIFGALASRPDLADGNMMLVLPGTHSKWAELEQGKITRFHSFPTGELFALLGSHSSLASPHSHEQPEPEGFSAGMESAQAGLLASLFEARVSRLICGRDIGWSIGFLSGLLIASEFREALQLLDRRPECITFIGEPDLVALYARVAQDLRVDANALDGDTSALAGLQLIGEAFSL